MKNTGNKSKSTGAIGTISASNNMINAEIKSIKINNNKKYQLLLKLREIQIKKHKELKNENT